MSAPEAALKMGASIGSKAGAGAAVAADSEAYAGVRIRDVANQGEVGVGETGAGGEDGRVGGSRHPYRHHTHRIWGRRTDTQRQMDLSFTSGEGRSKMTSFVRPVEAPTFSSYAETTRTRPPVPAAGDTVAKNPPLPPPRVSAARAPRPPFAPLPPAPLLQRRGHSRGSSPRPPASADEREGLAVGRKSG